MELPKRKYPRLKQYDYSLPGYYYVTIHTLPGTAKLSSVGWGLAPTAAQVRLTQLGRIAQEQLIGLKQRYQNVNIDKYVIMPNHIHVIMCLTEAVGASPHPTVPDIVGAYKSLVTRECNRISNTPGRKIFQRSFYETVLRNEQAYRECWQYIDNNPAKWLMEEKYDS